jgi:hypothetical protein
MLFSVTDYSYVAYIDESGELGVNYDAGSSHCLVMERLPVPFPLLQTREPFLVAHA